MYEKFVSKRGYGRSLIIVNEEGKALSFCEPTNSDYQRDVFPPRNWKDISDTEFDAQFQKKKDYLVDYKKAEGLSSIELIHFFYQKENRDCVYRDWNKAHGNACPHCYGAQGGYYDCRKGHSLDDCVGCEDYN